MHNSSCFSFQFYIKPQPSATNTCNMSVVSHSNSTSNHNQVAEICRRTDVVSHSIKPQLRRTCSSRRPSCFSFQFYIKPQLAVIRRFSGLGCFSFQFYIKPQPMAALDCAENMLFLIPILHQTTTSRMAVIHILHVTHMTPMHKTSCRTPGKLVGCNFVFQRAVYQKNSSC